MDDEDGLGCGVEATLLQTILPTRLQVAAVLLQVQTLPHVIPDLVMKSLIIC